MTPWGPPDGLSNSLAMFELKTHQDGARKSMNYFYQQKPRYEGTIVRQFYFCFLCITSSLLISILAKLGKF